ncbi:MAG TPA: helix-turn-helix transcriptional regulator, partial [Ktedonobacteraceae bacterium]|nr:helix-turn-helix transcriptional regulator [Ktedonobacteraceae bacterium]
MNVPNEKLQRARLEKHWSVAVASTRAGVSVNTFNRWERGLQIPQLGTLDQLCAAFEMSAEDLGFGNVVLPRKKTELFPMVERETRSCAAPMPGLLPGAGERPLVLNPVIRQPQVPYTEPAVPSSLFTDFSRRRAIAALIGTPASVFSSGHEEN